MEDDYSHYDVALIYILENVPGPTDNTEAHQQIVENFNSQLTNQCSCKNKCVPSTCNCIMISGGNINYLTDSANGIIKVNKEKFENSDSSPIIECNNLCSCIENCGNRLVQKGPVKSLYVKICSKNKGYGLYTTQFIHKYSFVCEYAGEIITETQAKIRHEHNLQTGKMNYIFCLNEHSNSKVSQMFVDPSEFGNIGRYVNHSCEPNCVIVPVRFNTPIPKLSLFSCKDILPHTEITFNYGSSGSIDLSTSVNGKRTICLCETSKCTGWMPYQMY